MIYEGEIEAPSCKDFAFPSPHSVLYVNFGLIFDVRKFQPESCNNHQAMTFGIKS